MNQDMFDKMKDGAGFIAALDQSGGSTPKALKLYGVEESAYSGDDEMFDLIHEMRSRIVADLSPPRKEKGLGDTAPIREGTDTATSS